MSNSEGNLILNCDAHDNYDLFTEGVHGDGFDFSEIAYRAGNPRENAIMQCRSWNNSDDGFDFWDNEGILYVYNSWAWHNGFNKGGNTPTGDGNGFKLGRTSSITSLCRIIANCIAFNNSGGGYTLEEMPALCNLFNNVAYHNGLGRWEAGFQGWNAYNIAHILRNNISYANPTGNISQFGSNYVHDHNSWNGGVIVTNDDFLSLDASQVYASRKSDGSLPDISFLHLKPDSDLVGAGVNVGLITDGAGHVWNDPPSIGAFEVASTILGGHASINFTAHGHFETLECVPDTDDFTLQDVCDVVHPSVNTLQTCFDEAVACCFDPAYEGDHDRLSNFRNYCIHNCYSHIEGNTAITFSAEGTGVEARRLYGNTSIIFGASGTGQCISSEGRLYGNTNITFAATGDLADKLPGIMGYGVLYNFPAVNTGNLAPTGWHVPTKTELETLVTYLGGSTVAGGKLKETGTVYWYSPNTGATDAYGFTARGGGFRTDTTGAFGNLKIDAVFGSSTNQAPYEWLLFLTYISAYGYVTRVTPVGNKAGKSIRCIKNDSTNPGTVTDYDGNVYATIKIGDQVWMKTNLGVTHYNNGTPIPNVTDTAEWLALTTGAYCYYDNDPNYGNIEEEIPQIRTAEGNALITFTSAGGLIIAVAPENFLAMQTGAGQHVRLTWDAVPGAVNYLVQRKVAYYDGNWFVWFADIYTGSDNDIYDEIQSEHGGPPEGTVVTYRVCVTTEAGNGPWSEENWIYYNA